MSDGVGVRLLCATVLAFMRTHLVLFGFRRSVRVARKLASWRTRDNNVDALVTGKRISRVVDQVSPVLPGRILCLEQSLTLFVLLRWFGVPARLRIGAVVRPFAAHAWVEADGQPINADTEFLGSYQAFPDLPE